MRAVHEAIRCASCGYHIVGLPSDGRCPECGASNEDSIARFRFAWSEGVRGIRQSAAAYLLSCGAALLMGLSALLLSDLPAAACLWISLIVPHVFSLAGACVAMPAPDGPRPSRAAYIGLLFALAPIVLPFLGTLLSFSDAIFASFVVGYLLLYVTCHVVVAFRWKATARAIGSPRMSRCLGVAMMTLVAALVLTVPLGVWGLLLGRPGPPPALVTVPPVVLLVIGAAINSVCAILILARIREMRQA